MYKQMILIIYMPNCSLCILTWSFPLSKISEISFLLNSYNYKPHNLLSSFDQKWIVKTRRWKYILIKHKYAHSDDLLLYECICCDKLIRFTYFIIYCFLFSFIGMSKNNDYTNVLHLIDKCVSMWYEVSAYCIYSIPIHEKAAIAKLVISHIHIFQITHLIFPHLISLLTDTTTFCFGESPILISIYILK